MKKRHRQHIKGMRVWSHFFKPDKRTWHFKEETEPCGEGNHLKHMSYSQSIRGNHDLSDILVSQPATHPWFIILWEPLNTKAPGPQLTQPYCCYINTVIFYVNNGGYIIRPFSKLFNAGGEWRLNRSCGMTRGIEFEVWDKTETRLRWDDVVDCNGQLFKCGGGTVVWAKKRWWMRHWARKHETLDQKLKSA